MPAFDFLTPTRVRRLARADLIGALVMLVLLGGCFGHGMIGGGEDAGTRVDERPMAMVMGLVFLVPYSAFLFLSSGLLRRWPRAGYITHVLAWNWPFIFVLLLGLAASVAG
jgi:hypothetical protein